MQFEWSEEKFLKGSVGHQIKLRFWNKLQMTDLILMQLTSYKYILTRKRIFQPFALIDFMYRLNFLVSFFDTLTLSHAFYSSALAAWIKVLSFVVCFKSVASFCHLQYLLKTSPRSIRWAWNSRIWHFHVNNTLLPWRNVWNLIFATSRPETWNWLVNLVDFSDVWPELWRYLKFQGTLKLMVVEISNHMVPYVIR